MTKFDKKFIYMCREMFGFSFGLRTYGIDRSYLDRTLIDLSLSDCYPKLFLFYAEFCDLYSCVNDFDSITVIDVELLNAQNKINTTRLVALL